MDESRVEEVDAFVHNVVAHPLLVLVPPLGRWLHGRTSPTRPAGWWRSTFGERTV